MQISARHLQDSSEVKFLCKNLSRKKFLAKFVQGKRFLARPCCKEKVSLQDLTSNALFEGSCKILTKNEFFVNQGRDKNKKLQPCHDDS